MNDKKAIRKEIILKRNEIDINKKKVFDLNIKEKLMNMEAFKKNKRIFIYVGYSSEIDTAIYIKEFLQLGKRVFIPRTKIEEKVMEAVEITSLDNLVKSKYGILEPDINIKACSKEELDLIIVPGLSFDKSGGRLGYGGGYYDKYMNSLDKSIKKIALCYDFQIINKVPCEEHDLKVDYIISNERVINCNEN